MVILAPTSEALSAVDDPAGQGRKILRRKSPSDRCETGVLCRGKAPAIKEGDHIGIRSYRDVSGLLAMEPKWWERGEAVPVRRIE